jgi:hypothetical protein
MVEFQRIKIKNPFMKAKFFIYQHKVKKNWAKQWEFYSTQMTKILNETISNHQKDEDLYKLRF